MSVPGGMSIFRTAPDAQEPIALQAVVAAAPDSTEDYMEVIVEQFSRHTRWRKCRWMPRPDVSPSRGDHALLVLSDEGDPWVVAWWPA